jgi:hypothetical protein
MGRRIAATALFFCLEIAALHARPLAELDVVMEPTMVAGAQQCGLFTAWASTDAWTRQPVGGQIEAILEKGNDSLPLLALAFEPGVWTPLCWAVPDGAVGNAAVRFRLQTAAGPAEERVQVNVLHRERIHLALDRPQARPGERVRWRLLRTRTVNGEPVEGGGVELSLKDARGNAVWAGEVQTGPGGMASGEWPLDTQCALGPWRAEAKLGD